MSEKNEKTKNKKNEKVQKFNFFSSYYFISYFKLLILRESICNGLYTIKYENNKFSFFLKQILNFISHCKEDSFMYHPTAMSTERVRKLLKKCNQKKKRVMSFLRLDHNSPTLMIIKDKEYNKDF